MKYAHLDSVWVKYQPPSFSTHLTFQDHGRHYVMQRGFPHYLAEVLRAAETEQEGLLISDKVANAVSSAQVTGYLIWLVFAGALGGNQIIIESDWKQKLDSRLRAMADFYLLDRILLRKEKFRRFEIK